jgi:hypothetical protein
MRISFNASICSLALLFCLLPNASAQDAVRGEVRGSMPGFYSAALDSLRFPLSWNNFSSQVDEPEAGAGTFNAWREEARRVLWFCMGAVPPQAPSCDMKVLDEEKRDGYRALKIEFNVSAWSRVPAYLLIPDGQGPFPALLVLHDHGAHFTIGKEKVVRPFAVPDSVLADSKDWVAKCYDGVYVGDFFARQGYVVLAVDALCWGERGRLEGPDYNVQQALASNMMQLGMSWAGCIVSDDVNSAGLLASLPQVDPERIGALGFSFGAWRAWMVSAATDLVAASAAVCWMDVMRSLVTPVNNQSKGGSAYSMLVPGLVRYMDYPDAASIACPKPALFYNGLQDRLFPVEGVREAYSGMSSVWNSRGVSGALETKLWDGKHFFSREMQAGTLEFFNRWLKAGR